MMMCCQHTIFGCMCSQRERRWFVSQLMMMISADDDDVYYYILSLKKDPRAHWRELSRGEPWSLVPGAVEHVEECHPHVGTPAPAALLFSRGRFLRFWGFALPLRAWSTGSIRFNRIQAAFAGSCLSACGPHAAAFVCAASATPEIVRPCRLRRADRCR